MGSVLRFVIAVLMAIAVDTTVAGSDVAAWEVQGTPAPDPSAGFLANSARNLRSGAEENNASQPRNTTATCSNDGGPCVPLRRNCCQGLVCDTYSKTCVVDYS